MFLDESVIDKTEFCRKVEKGRRVPDVIRSLVNAADLKLKYARLFNETFFVSILMYGNKTLIWKEKGGLGLGLYRCTISEYCWLTRELVKTQMHR